MLATADEIATRPLAPRSLAARWHDLRLERNDAYAVLTTACYCLVAAVLCFATGSSFTPGLGIIGLIPGFFFLTAMGWHLVRPAERQLFQILTFIALWGALPIAGTQLTFFANMVGLPLRSETFLAMDRSLGFDWLGWANFVQSHPLLEQVTNQAYLSYAFQPYIAVVVVTFLGPPSRNANFLLAIALALSVTIIISAMLPAIGPGRGYGYSTPVADAMLAVRDGQRAGLPYIGIISFPSFHSAMACLFVMVYRGHRIPLLLAGGLNMLMLLSVPFSGDHYLVDLLAGVAVAVISQCVADRITRAEPITVLGHHR